MAINYEEIERKLASMRPSHKLYKLVKAEMVKRGNWRNKSRGIGFKSGQDDRRKPLRDIFK